MTFGTVTYWIGAVSAVTFIVVFLLDGWTRRAYSSIRHLSQCACLRSARLGPNGQFHHVRHDLLCLWEGFRKLCPYLFQQGLECLCS